MKFNKYKFDTRLMKLHGVTVLDNCFDRLHQVLIINKIKTRSSNKRELVYDYARLSSNSVEGDYIEWIVKQFRDNNLTFESIKPTKQYIDLGKHEKKAYTNFYKSKAWISLRRKVLYKHGRCCMKCGETKGEFHIDHIKPRSKFIELELCIDNLQVLCKSCNLEKSNKNEIDYRPNDVAELQDSVSDNWMAIK
jgi:hypothetical protein